MRHERIHRPLKAAIFALLAAAFLPACTPGGDRAGKSDAAAPGAAAPAIDAGVVAAARFACAGGKSIAAEFRRGSVSLSLSDGRRMELPRTISGSGARYADANGSFVFWNKGDGAFIQEDGMTTYDGCRKRPV